MANSLTIFEKLTRIKQIKELIRVAINTKGVTVENTVPLNNYPEKILEIEQGSGPVIEYPLVKVLEEDWDDMVKEDDTLYAIV